MSTTNVDSLGVEFGTGTSTVGAATVNTQTGLITTEALTTAAGATYTFTLTNSRINASSVVNVMVSKGTATTGTPTVAWITPAAGSVVFIIQNIHAAAALNGTIKLGFSVFNITSVNS